MPPIAGVAVGVLVVGALGVSKASGAPAPAPPAPVSGATGSPDTPRDLFARGIAARAAGRHEEAVRLLSVAAPAAANPDHAWFYAAESALAAGATADARRWLDLVASMRGSRLAAAAAWRAAEAAWTSGDRAEAARRYARLERGAPGGDRVLARFRGAEWLADRACGDASTARTAATSQAREALRRFSELAATAADHALGDAALARAQACATRVGASAILTPRQWLARAEGLARARRWDAAAAALREIGDGAGRAVAGERDLASAMLLYRRRDYAGAAPALAAAATRLSGEAAATAAFHAVRALSRQHRDDDAIAGYARFVKQHPRSRLAPEAQFLTGWLEWNRGRFREALPGLRECAKRFPRSPFAREAAWFSALAALLGGDPAAALAMLERAPLHADPRRVSEDGDAAGYFAARALAALERGPEARARLTRVARDAPLGYYGMLARARLAELGDKLTPALPDPRGADDGLGAATEAGDAARPSPPQGAEDPRLAAVDELAAVGLPGDAAALLRRHERAVLRRAGAAAGYELLFSRYTRLGDHARAYQLADVRGRAHLATRPVGAARPYWLAAYPRAHRELVEDAQRGAAVPELLIYAVMRKESGFSPDAVSYADARGLMQVIPATAVRLGRWLGVPRPVEDLFVPAVNVRLGAAYLDALFRGFGGQAVLTAAAYNAGPEAVRRLLARHGARPLDEFVELITFTQTRNYVKRVLTYLARYRYLYGPAPLELTLTIDPTVRSDGPGGDLLASSTAIEAAAAEAPAVDDAPDPR